MWGRLTVNHVRSLRPVTEASARAVAEWKARGRVVPIEELDTFVLDVAPERDTGRPPFFVLHGFPTCSFDWRAVLPALARERRVVLFDFFGFGLSAKPDVRYSIRAVRRSGRGGRPLRGTRVRRAADARHGRHGRRRATRRDLEGQLDLTIEARVLTNGSIYIEMAHLTPGPAVPAVARRRAGRAAGGTDDPGANVKAGVGSTFASAHPATDEDGRAVGARRAQRRQHTHGAHHPVHRRSARRGIAVHGGDRAASLAAGCRVGGRGPGCRGRDDGTPARRASGYPTSSSSTTSVIIRWSRRPTASPKRCSTCSPPTEEPCTSPPNTAFRARPNRSRR